MTNNKENIVLDPTNHGMPLLKSDGPVTSFFEFWPTKLVYAPVFFYWLILSIRYRSLTLPLLANPSIFLSGMVGESKSQILELSGDIATQWIEPFVTVKVGDEPKDSLLATSLLSMKQAHLSFPIVAKPDQGCRGAGVKLLKDESQLAKYIESFPRDNMFLLQRKADSVPEAGVFYIRHPEKETGEIFSLTLKYTPYVIGDGVKTLEQLIQSDKRANQLKHLYVDRHKMLLSRVLPKGERFALVFSGSHCRGSIFRNGAEYITEPLRERMDEILKDVEGFYYGRLDVKFKDIESFMKGENFSIVEINGASSEATHIWDNKSTLKEVYRSLFYQYGTLFKLGQSHRKRGLKPPSLRTFIKAWRDDKELGQHYPETD